MGRRRIQDDSEHKRSTEIEEKHEKSPIENMHIFIKHRFGRGFDSGHTPLSEQEMMMLKIQNENIQNTV